MQLIKTSITRAAPPFQTLSGNPLRNALQIQSMLSDIKMLDAAIGAGGQSACTPGDEIWAAAERCKRWQPRVQDMLMQDLPETMLAAVLEGNDTLNLILFKWEVRWPPLTPSTLSPRQRTSP